MMKQGSVSGVDIISQPFDKQGPFQKLISSDSLSFLPNLYYRKYRLLDSLNHAREQFPQQKLLLPRQTTRWDAVLDEMKEKSLIFQEMKKYKIAEKYHLAKTIKAETLKRFIKNEERQLFHRIICNQLSENVIDLFKKQKDAPKIEVKQEQIVQQVPEVNPKKNHVDDIFMDPQEFLDDIKIEDNLIDDLFNEQPKKISELEVEQFPAIEPISTYIQAKYAEDNYQIDALPNKEISRRACFKRINENVRKRIKIKDEEETQSQGGRSLSSATVFLSNLLNTEADSKNMTNIVELPNKTQWLFQNENTKIRKKKDKDQQFQLNWNEDQLAKMDKINEKFNIRKGKMDKNILVLSMSNQDQEYKKYFEKNYIFKKSFPPTLKQIPKVQIQDRKRYYNEFHDKQYEQFIMKNNKKQLLQKFSQNSQYMFAQDYSCDGLQQNQNLSIGKMFVYPPNKIRNRIIYKLTDYKLTATIKNYDKCVMPMDRDRLIMLSFFVRKYLKQFGNNWKLICQFIELNTIFSKYLITPEFIQEVYQLVQKYDNEDEPFEEIQLWDKKILPFSGSGCDSYVEYDQRVASKLDQEIQEEVEKMEEESQTVEFDVSNYQKQINKPLNEPHSFSLESTANSYQNYLKKFANGKYLPFKSCTQKLQDSKVLNSVIRSYDIPDHNQQPVKQQNHLNSTQKEWAFSYVQQNLKGEVKVGAPCRKKKNINERNNELVKILQALRTKAMNNTTTPMPLNKKPEDAKQNNSSSQLPKAVIPPATNAQKASETGAPAQQKKPLPQKTPEKKLGPSNSLAGKKKKTKDQQEPK